MPLIQIEQDNPELIALVNSQIEDMSLAVPQALTMYPQVGGIIDRASALSPVFGSRGLAGSSTIIRQWRRLGAGV